MFQTKNNILHLLTTGGHRLWWTIFLLFISYGYLYYKLDCEYFFSLAPLTHFIFSLLGPICVLKFIAVTWNRSLGLGINFTISVCAFSFDYLLRCCNNAISRVISLDIALPFCLYNWIYISRSSPLVCRLLINMYVECAHMLF